MYMWKTIESHQSSFSSLFCPKFQVSIPPGFTSHSGSFQQTQDTMSMNEVDCIALRVHQLYALYKRPGVAAKKLLFLPKFTISVFAKFVQRFKM